jgi:hypothetical protein
MVRYLLFISALLFIAPKALADGVFMVVKGDVKVEKAGKLMPAKVGMKVVQTDTIIAGKDARAKVVMTDKNVLNISPDSKIVIEKYVPDQAKGDKNVVLNVLYGKVRSTVNQKYDGEKEKFHVKTPSAVAGVRGTDFISSYNSQSKQAEFVTFEGKVEVGNLGAGGKIVDSVFVNPGQMTASVNGAPPDIPVEVPKTELAKMQNETKADFNGGKQDQRQPANEPAPNKNDKGDKKSDGGKPDPSANNTKGPKNEGVNGEGNDKGDGETKSASRGRGPGPGGQGVGRGPASVAGEPSLGADGTKPPPENGLPPPPGPCMFCDVIADGGGGGDYIPPGPEMPYLPPLPPPPMAELPKDLVNPDFVQQNRTLLIINVVYQ